MSVATDPATKPVRRDLYPLRFIGTALSFFTFSLFGLLLGLFAYPPLLLIRPLDRRRRVARLMIRGFFQAFVGMMRLFWVLTVRIENPERLRTRGCLIVANHPSLLDVVMLVAMTPDAAARTGDEYISRSVTHKPVPFDATSACCASA